MTAESFTIDIQWQHSGEKACADFVIGAGVTALIGPSGAGKTTIARMITGLTSPTSGMILRGSEPLFDAAKGVAVPTAKRTVGYVAQEPGLFPTMSVRDNVTLGSRLPSNDLIALYAATGIEALLERNPRTLSGGEARRVSIARALATKPCLMILDEPMNGLDPKRRRSLLSLIRRLSYHTQTPVLLITHQVEEMLFAADNAVLVANQNTLLSGTIEEVLAAPATQEHLGLDDAGAILTATVLERNANLLKAQVGAQEIWLTDDQEPIGSKVRLRILSRDVGIAAQKIENISILNQLQSSVSSIEARGHERQITLTLQGSEQHLSARLTSKSFDALKIAEGKPVIALIKAVAVKEMMAD